MMGNNHMAIRSIFSYLAATFHCSLLLLLTTFEGVGDVGPAPMLAAAASFALLAMAARSIFVQERSVSKPVVVGFEWVGVAAEVSEAPPPH